MSETVFVVGAGASCEFGLPSGPALKAQIAKLIDIRFDGPAMTSGDPSIADSFRHFARASETLAGNINPILHKCWVLRDALPAAISIDNLLHAHKGDELIEIGGKIGIVKAILNAERGSVLYSERPEFHGISLPKIENSWLMSFFKMAAEGITKGELETLFDNVSIVCFNYDRCIEAFMPHAISKYYGISYDDALPHASRLKIIHPYGSMGPIYEVPFGERYVDLLKSARSILTFSEGISDQDLIGDIHNLIIGAETICFLGFAFHPMNMILLSPPSVTCASRILSTSYGLSEADESVIERFILDMVRKPRTISSYSEGIDLNPDYVPVFASMTCGDFFQSYFRSLSAPI